MMILIEVIVMMVLKINSGEGNSVAVNSSTLVIESAENSRDWSKAAAMMI